MNTLECSMVFNTYVQSYGYITLKSNSLFDFHTNEIKHLSKAYKILEKEAAYFLTFQIVGWVDIFTRKIYRDIAIESLIYCQHNRDLEIFAYVIMSNHIHLFARSCKDDLSGTIRDFQRFSYTSAIFKNKQTQQIWTHENHAEHIFSQKLIEQ